VYQAEGLSAFQAHEASHAGQPLAGGPFKPLLEALHRLQTEGTSNMRVRTALVTARSAPAHERAIRTLMNWGVDVDEAMFLGGLPKGPFLREFEPDFFFDDQTGACSVIDFDDTMYHWYGMDITQALASLREEFAEEDFPNKQAVFMEGYRSEFETPQDLQDCMPVFRRFANAYQYTRVSLSVRESWDNEPEWMLGLRAKLNGLLARNAGQFGTPL